MIFIDVLLDIWECYISIIDHDWKRVYILFHAHSEIDARHNKRWSSSQEQGGQMLQLFWLKVIMWKIMAGPFTAHARAVNIKQADIMTGIEVAN